MIQEEEFNVIVSTESFTAGSGKDLQVWPGEGDVYLPPGLGSDDGVPNLPAQPGQRGFGSTSHRQEEHER